MKWRVRQDRSGVQYKDEVDGFEVEEEGRDGRAPHYLLHNIQP